MTSKLFEDPSTLCNFLDRAKELYPKEVDVETMYRRFAEILTIVTPELRSRIEYIGPCLSLPSHRASKEEIDKSIGYLHDYLERAKPSEPSLIVIAKSVTDEYTPSDQALYIQKKVLECLGPSAATQQRQRTENRRSKSKGTQRVEKIS